MSRVFWFFQPVPRVANQCPHFHAGHLGKLRSSFSFIFHLYLAMSSHVPFFSETPGGIWGQTKPETRCYLDGRTPEAVSLAARGKKGSFGKPAFYISMC